jgi:hypothetical protein
MLEGFLSSQWQQAQQKHYTSRRSRRSSRRWAKGLFLKLHHLAWHQWDHRNSIKHRVARPRDYAELRRLNYQICLLYQNEGRDLPPALRYHFSDALINLLIKPTHYKKHWLSNVISIKRRHARRSGNVNHDIATPEQLALLRWMETGRPC